MQELLDVDRAEYAALLDDRDGSIARANESGSDLHEGVIG
jgi:hypothetical protein